MFSGPTGEGFDLQVLGQLLFMALLGMAHATALRGWSGLSVAFPGWNCMLVALRLRAVPLGIALVGTLWWPPRLSEATFGIQVEAFIPITAFSRGKEYCLLTGGMWKGSVPNVVSFIKTLGHLGRRGLYG